MFAQTLLKQALKEGGERKRDWTYQKVSYFFCAGTTFWAKQKKGEKGGKVMETWRGRVKVAKINGGKNVTRKGGKRNPAFFLDISDSVQDASAKFICDIFFPSFHTKDQFLITH